MANNEIIRLLQFANMQMAAEAFLMEGDESLVPQNAVSLRLTRGNTHASRFTPNQANRFVEEYEVLAQYRNDPLQGGGSGFSGTLFKNRSTGELTLSFRSTEFRDDAARDNKATNQLEITQLGWALGQIADMEAWYAELRSDPNFLGGRNFNVTGYSLGGHLATAFNILRREEYANAPEFNPVVATYTFNGAGTGSLLNSRRLTDILSDFNRIRANFSESTEWKSLSEGVQDNLRTAAQMRVDAIAAERFRVAGLSGLNPAFGISGPAGNQVLLGYQIAALLVARDTRGSLASNPTPTMLRLAPSDRMFSNMIEVVGMETNGLATSFVSNSGIHYGTRTELAIEAQPLFRGNFPFAATIASALEQSFKLLVDNPGQNDFGDTHSLVLLLDSLSLMAAMEKLDPEFTPELGQEIFAAASNARATESLGSQGTAEGDTLERVLDALYKLVYGSPAESLLAYEAVLAGNTWHSIDHRAPFHERLATLNTVIDELTSAAGAPAYSFESLATYSSADIVAFAQKDDATGKAYRYALRELNPFVLLANDDFYAPHNIAGELELYDSLTHINGISDEWIGDRAEFLAWKNLDSIQNGEDTLRGAAVESYVFESRSPTGEVDISLAVVGRAAINGNASAAANPVQVIFGDDGADQLSGGIFNDRLYGGGGDDILRGGQGNDYLEGGIGSDTYVWNTGDGFDTLMDADGVGRIVIDGIALTGGIQIAQSDYISTDEQYLLHFEGDLATGGVLIVNGDLRIENFTNGKLGIALGDQGGLSELQPTTTIFQEPMPISSGPGNLGFGTDGNDYLLSTGAVFIAKAGDDFLETAAGGGGHFSGGAGDDLLIGGEIRVMVETGGGDSGEPVTTKIVTAPETHHGGGGADIILGGDGVDNIWGDFPGFTISAFDFVGSSFHYTENQLDPLDSSGFFVDHILGNTFEPLPSSSEDIANPRPFPGDLISGLRYVLGINEAGPGRAFYDDFIDAGDGDDRVVGGFGSDTIFGGDGNDSLRGDGFSLDFLGHAFSLRDEQWGNEIINLFGAPGDDFLDGGAGNDLLMDLEGGSDILIGGDGDDTIETSDPPSDVAVSNYLSGGAGNDRLRSNNRSTSGFDTFFGGTGSDSLGVAAAGAYLDGGPGDDFYSVSITSTPHNSITVNDYDAAVGNFDQLLMFFSTEQAGPAADILITRDASNLYFGVGGVANLVSIQDWFSGDAYKIEHIFTVQLASVDSGEGGSIENFRFFDVATLEGLFATPTESADFLWGSAGSDQFSGGPGDDTVFGEAGDDVLAGNEGSDVLDGGDGSDLYVFHSGDGVDRIEDTGGAGADGISFGQGITPDLLVWRPDLLSLDVGPGGDSILFEAVDPAVARNPGGIEYLQFADGTTMYFQQLLDPDFVPGGSDPDFRLGGFALDGTDFSPGGDPGTASGASEMAGGSVHDGEAGGNVLNTGTGSIAGGLEEVAQVETLEPTLNEALGTVRAAHPAGVEALERTMNEALGTVHAAHPAGVEALERTLNEALGTVHAAHPAGAKALEPTLNEALGTVHAAHPAGVPALASGMDPFSTHWQLEHGNGIDQSGLTVGEQGEHFFQNQGSFQTQSSDNLDEGRSLNRAGLGLLDEPRRSAALVESYFRIDSRNEFESFTQEFARGGGRAQLLTPEEIAQSWGRIDTYLDEMSDELDEDARYGAGEWRDLHTLNLLYGGSPGGAFGHAGSTGTTRGFANLKTLHGLRDGFEQLPLV